MATTLDRVLRERSGLGRGATKAVEGVAAVYAMVVIVVVVVVMVVVVVVPYEGGRE